MPFFSIIIPVYNVAPYLRECLDSVLAQKFTEWEAICVDDGSTDGSNLILGEYAAKDSRIVVMRQANLGVVVARKIGLVSSRGKWILFLDADDWIDVDMLCGLFALISGNDPDILQFGYVVEDGCSSTNYKPILSGGFSSVQFMEQVRMSPLEILGMCIGNKCYRRSVINRAFSDIADIHIQYGEDGLLAISALCVMRTIYFSCRIFYHYRTVQGSALRRYYRNIVQDAECFIKTAASLVAKANIMNDKQIRLMNHSHAHSILLYIFEMALCRAKNKDECCGLLRNLSESNFFELEDISKVSFMRKCMRFIILHEHVAWFLRGFLTKKLTRQKNEAYVCNSRL